MTLRDLAGLVISNLRRMKGRVIMTALGVVIGTAAVVVLVSLGAGLQREATQSLGSGGGLTELRVSTVQEGSAMAVAVPGGGVSVATQQRSDAPRLDAEMLDEIRALPSVEAVYPMQNLQMGAQMSFGQLSAYAQIIGVDPAMLADLVVSEGTTEIHSGQVVIGARVPENFRDFEEMKGGTRAGVVVANPGDVQIPDLYLQMIQMQLQRFSQEDGTMAEKSVRFQVVGILAPVGWQHDYVVYAPLRDVIAYNSWRWGSASTPSAMAMTRWWSRRRVGVRPWRRSRRSVRWG